MDVVRAVQFPLNDQDWPSKVILGTLLSIIPFVGPGYQVHIARNVIQGKPHPLPGSDELGQVFTDGIMATIAGLIYSLPALILSCILFFPVSASNSDTGFVVFCLLCFCLLLPLLVCVVLAGAFYWTGMLRYAGSGNFSSFLEFGALWREMRAHFDILLMLLVYVVALAFAALFVAPFLAATIIGILLLPVLGFWFQIAVGHLVGQAGIEMAQGG